jgi:hypothetical protein
MLVTERETDRVVSTGTVDDMSVNVMATVGEGVAFVFVLDIEFVFVPDPVTDVGWLVEPLTS